MAAKKKASSAKAAQKPPTKSEIIGTIADKTGLTRKDVSAVFDNLNALIKKNVGRRGPGEFTVPGLLKVRVVKKPATKARKGINPFTGEEMVFKAKPARKAVKLTALKGLKDML
jgi:nucleoid DNA-binding protein